MVTHPVQHAIELIKSDQIKEAREVLLPVLRANPHHIAAWLCYASTFDTTQHRIQALETAAQLNPGSAEIQRRLERLRAELPQVQADPAEPEVKPAAAPSEPVAAPAALPAAAVLPLAAVAPTPAEVAQPPSVIVPPSADKPRQPQAGVKRPARPGLVWLWAVITLLLVVFAGALVLMIQNTPKNPADYRHTDPFEYYLYVPSAYKPGETWPLFVGIHGSGGSGLDCWNLWQSYADQEKFILLCPSLANPDGGWYQDEGERKLFSILHQVRQTVQVEDRYFLVGFSAGAQFVQGVTFAYPASVKATAVLSAGNYVMPASSASGIPFLVVIGDADDPIAVDTSKQFADVLGKLGAKVDYRLLPGMGHEVSEQSKHLTIDFFRRTNNKR